MNFNTGHLVVDAVGQLHLSGNLVHHSWYQHIRYSNKRGEFTDPWAVNILADIVYWYRPVEVRDEQTGHLLGYRKKFLEDKLQRSPEAFSELFCCSIKVVREALKLLEKLNLIDIELRAVKTDWGVIPTAMFIGLNSTKLKEITHSTSKPQNLEKSLLPKSVRRNAEMGKEGYPNGNGALPIWENPDAEMGNSSIYIDFTENSQKITQESNPPLIPPVGGEQKEDCLEQGEADSILNLEQEASTFDTLENQEDATGRSDDSIVSVEDKYSAGGVVTLELCDDRNKTKKQKEQEMADCFLAAYLEHKPSNFTTHQRLTSEHLKKIKALVKVYGDRSLNIFVGALTWCREQNDDWWRKTQFSLSNLMSNGKIEEYADKHFHALETDRAYCDRVEGRAISKDSKRSNGVQVFNEQGEEITGAAARAAQAVAGDPLLALFLEQI